VKRERGWETEAGEPPCPGKPCSCQQPPAVEMLGKANAASARHQEGWPLGTNHIGILMAQTFL